MKVFKIESDNGYHYGVAACNQQSAEEFFLEASNDLIVKTEEIPESEWDKKTLKVYEENDFDRKPMMDCIRNQILGDHAQLVFTNDYSIID